MKTLSAVAVVTCGIVALGVAVAHAQGMGPWHKHEGGPGPGGPGMFAMLELNADQVHQVAELRAAMLTKTATTAAELRVKEAELGVLWTAAQPDRKAILAKGNEIDGLRAKLREARVDFAIAVLKILTAEQRARVPAALLGHGFGGGPGMGMGMEMMEEPGMGPGHGHEGCPCHRGMGD
jgi:Spy/CpxP family protein refolding chaperone